MTVLINNQQTKQLQNDEINQTAKCMKMNTYLWPFNAARWSGVSPLTSWQLSCTLETDIYE